MVPEACRSSPRMNQVAVVMPAAQSSPTTYPAAKSCCAQKHPVECTDHATTRKKIRTGTPEPPDLADKDGGQLHPDSFSSPGARDDLNQILATSELRHSPDIWEKMDEEMQLFPGSNEWASDELRLFRILFLREHSPLLPHDWSMDFRGIPVPDNLFSKIESYRPIIRSLAGNSFKATKALIRLIGLTSTVRSLVQTEQQDKVPGAIRRELDEYAKWAAHDGGFGDLDIVPNLIIDAVDIAVGSDGVEEYMQYRMRSLACKHRKYWKIEQVGEDEAWRLPKVPSVGTRDTGPGLERTDAAPTPEIKVEDLDEPFVRTESRYTQRPPILYGIFVIHHSAVVLTIDSSKEGDDAYVSYQVEVGFNIEFQGVWNAITMAIVICLARDHMVTMANDFVQLVESPESDPDV